MRLTKELLKAFLVQAFLVLARLLLTGFGGMLIERGLVQDGQFSSFLVGLATVLATLVWSLVERHGLLKLLGLAMDSEEKNTLEDLRK